MRRTFVCLGDAVNLAARLMAQAPPGGVYVGSFAKGLAGDSFAWEALPPLQLKGKAEPVAVYSLAGGSGHVSRRHRRYELEILGRRTELAALSAALDRTIEGRGNTVGIAAEAGLGKSRLIAEFVRGVRAGGGLVAFGECPAFGTHADYFVWQEIWRTLLRVDSQQSDEEQRRALERELAAIDPGLVQRAPLLGPVLGIADPGERPHRRRSTRSCGRRRSRACSRSACGRARPRSSWWSCSRTATGSGRSRATCWRRSCVHRRRCPSSSCSRTGRPRRRAATSASSS